MLDVLKTEVLQPVTRRLGFALAGFLVAKGIDADLANQIATGVMATALALSDLALSRAQRATRDKRMKTEGFRDAYNQIQTEQR